MPSFFFPCQVRELYQKVHSYYKFPFGFLSLFAFFSVLFSAVLLLGVHCRTSGYNLGCSCRQGLVGWLVRPWEWEQQVPQRSNSGPIVVTRVVMVEIKFHFGALWVLVWPLFGLPQVVLNHAGLIPSTTSCWFVFSHSIFIWITYLLWNWELRSMNSPA